MPLQLRDLGGIKTQAQSREDVPGNILGLQERFCVVLRKLGKGVEKQSVASIVSV